MPIEQENEMPISPMKRRSVVLAVIAGLLAAAGAGVSADREKSDRDLGKFIVHEWGTFLSVQGSDGKTLGGMVDSEEDLPKFVRERELDGRNRACLFQKMETPVTYFYVDRPRTVRVRVGMKNGLLTHWYPAVGSFGPRVGKESTLGSTDSFLDWEEIELAPDTRAPVGPNQGVPGFKPVKATDTWRFARETDAAFVVQRKKEPGPYVWIVTTKKGAVVTGNLIGDTEEGLQLRDSAGKIISISKADVAQKEIIRDGRTARVLPEGEREKFLFYRGLGSFELPLEVRASGAGADERLLLRNLGPDVLRGAVAVQVRGRDVWFAPLPNLEGGAVHEVSTAALTRAANVEDIKKAVSATLVNAGLYPKEAQAMGEELCPDRRAAGPLYTAPRGR
jgi:hypothetical protein